MLVEVSNKLELVYGQYRTFELVDGRVEEWFFSFSPPFPPLGSLLSNV